MPTSTPVQSRIRKIFRKAITFDGATGSGAVGSVAVATVAGTVLVHALNVHCTTSLTSSGGTIALGISGQTEGIIADTTASGIDAGYQWNDVTPLKIGTPISDIVLSDNLIFTVGTASISAGVLEVDIIYESLTSDGIVS